MLSTTPIPPIHLLNFSPGVLEALLAVHRPLDITDSLTPSPRDCQRFKIPIMLPSCDRHGLSRTRISTKHRGSQGMRWGDKLAVHGKPISYFKCSTVMINICPSRGSPSLLAAGTKVYNLCMPFRAVRRTRIDGSVAVIRIP
jgi:hypothetical protein